MKRMASQDSGGSRADSAHPSRVDVYITEDYCDTKKNGNKGTTRNQKTHTQESNRQVAVKEKQLINIVQCKNWKEDFSLAKEKIVRFWQKNIGFDERFNFCANQPNYSPKLPNLTF